MTAGEPVRNERIILKCILEKSAVKNTEVIQHTIQRRASMMETMNFRRVHSVQVKAKSADKRYKTDRVSFNNLYYTGRF